MMRGDVPAVRELLRGHDPALVDGEPYVGAIGDVERVLERVRSETHGGSLSTAAVRRRNLRRRLVLTLGAGATALGVLLGTGMIGPQASIDPAAAAAALDAAKVARAGADPGTFGPGKVWYVRSLERATNDVAGRDGKAGYTYFTVQSMETWVSGDGKIVLRYRLVGNPTFPSTQDREAFAADPDAVETMKQARDIDYQSDDGLQSYRELTALPADPDVLFAHLKAEAKGKTDDTYREMFTLASDALRDPAPLPPAVRAALYEVIARIPRVRLVRNTTDLAGRQCSALEFPSSYLGVYETQEQLFFDPRTAEPRGGRYLVTRNLTPFGPRAGSDEGFTTIEAAGFVDATGSTHILR